MKILVQPALYLLLLANVLSVQYIFESLNTQAQLPCPVRVIMFLVWAL